MIVLNERNCKILEIDNELFDDVKKYLKKLNENKNKSFSYIDECGDKVIVMGNKEYVVPSNEDVKEILLSKKEDFFDEDEVKKILIEVIKADSRGGIYK